MRRIKVTFFSLTSRRISAAVIGMVFLLIYDDLRLPNRDQKVIVEKRSDFAGELHSEGLYALQFDSLVF